MQMKLHRSNLQRFWNHVLWDDLMSAIKKIPFSERKNILSAIFSIYIQQNFGLLPSEGMDEW